MLKSVSNKNICVVGLGYIGLPTAALLANKGYQVYGVDINPVVVETINQGKIHIVEPELDTFVKSAVNSGKLKASTTPTSADIYIIAVPTPFKSGNIPNIDYVIAATKSITPYIKKGSIVILESTSPVGTTEKIKSIFQESGIDTNDLYIAYCPERVLPGKIMRELIENDRVVGGLNNESSEIVSTFYKTFVNGEVLVTNSRTAEMCKLVENSYRDVNIAFANELSMICDTANINVWQLIELANRHPRVNILQPGCGVGGHCIAVDPWFLVADFPKEANLIKCGREVNDYKTKWVIEKVINTALEFQLAFNKKPVIACLGLAFKPDVDDLRESAALHIAQALDKLDYEVLSVEPNIEESKVASLNLVKLDFALTNADIVIYLVKHKQFLSLEINDKKVLDFCGLNVS